ncbi:cytochrome oxidase assembly protein-domain-containing protein [Zopfochytrium polystomum]|nr:cytochrome oxidase assembly protein-domain-containing protein [Zopfochytrium polystomum]
MSGPRLGLLPRIGASLAGCYSLQHTARSVPNVVPPLLSAARLSPRTGSPCLLTFAACSLRTKASTPTPNQTPATPTTRRSANSFVSSSHTANSQLAVNLTAAPIRTAHAAAAVGTTEEEPASYARESESSTQTKRIVGYWYLLSGSLVFIIVAVGGLTRLTESGLSIVEWNLIKGMKPPRSQEEWEAEFEKYKQFPEYKLLNHNITLNEFKFIFYMEWGHRMIGRLIGLAFIIPGAYFAMRGYMSPSIRNRSLLVAALIASQGVLGWYMVKSGLREELMNAKSFHGVSQYWLAAHLGSAFAIYSIMVMTGLEILQRTSKNAEATAKRYAHIVAAMVLMTAISGGTEGNDPQLYLSLAFTGAFVAGLDAGLIYNEFPFMGDGIVPSDYLNYSRKSATITDPIPVWRNIFENPAAVQFNHRLLAVTTATLACSLWAISRRVALPRASRVGLNLLLGVTGLQVTLGITTLLYLSGSLLLLTSAMYLMHTLRLFK